MPSDRTLKMWNKGTDKRDYKITTSNYESEKQKNIKIKPTDNNNSFPVCRLNSMFWNHDQECNSKMLIVIFYLN